MGGFFVILTIYYFSEFRAILNVVVDAEASDELGDDDKLFKVNAIRLALNV